MKKIVILLILIILSVAPQGVSAVVAPLCPMDGKPTTVVKNELPCIKVSDCGDVGYKNECEEEVYYTDLECWDDGRYQSYEKDGFKILNNEALLARDRYSRPVGSASAGEEYYRRINYSGGAWLPCKAKESFCDETNKQITVKFRKGSEIYEITTNWYCGGEFPGIVSSVKSSSNTIAFIIILFISILVIRKMNRNNLILFIILFALFLIYISLNFINNFFFQTF